MKIASIFLLVNILIFSGKLNAQTDSVAPSPSTMVTLQTEQTTSFQNNIIKLNLTDLFWKNFTFQYERVIKKYLSGALAVRFMPNGSIPYKNFIYKQIGDDDPQTQETIDNIKINNFAITPEVRFYLGKKGFGQGFYVAPTYRFAKFNISNIEINYSENSHPDSVINMSGKLSANYGGLMIGAQWFLGKHFTLDWWIFGPIAGKQKSSFNGYSSVALSPDDQQQIRDNIDDLDIPRTDITYSVDAHNVNMKLHGPLAGISFGLAFGFRF